LEHGHQEQPEAEHREAPHEDRADRGNLLVELDARAGDGELPFDIASRELDGAFDHAQRLLRELGGIIVERSEEHTSELQSLMRISYAVFCLKKKKTTKQ